MRKSQLSDKHIDSIFRKMYGIRDKETLRGEGRWLWTKTVSKAYRDQEKNDKKAGIKRIVPMPKETFAESCENFREAWQEFVNTILNEFRKLFKKRGKND